VPDGQTTVAGRNIELGNGSADVRATHTGSTYTTEVGLHGSCNADRLTLGATLPHGAHPSAVYLDAHRVRDFQVTQTNRGAEVTVLAYGGHNTLTIQV